jgi:NAD(P)-dependent dehydrogenase (short-subunit alcohol dehydrogenase family)
VTGRPPASAATSTAQGPSPDPTGVHGRACVVTGATRGIGRATAIAFARLGAQVILVGRDELRLDEVRAEARRAARDASVFWIHADFASLASVRQAAEEIAHRWPAIRVLVNNAGLNSARRALSADGYELTFAVNHLAPFLFTTLLVPALSSGLPSRIVNVGSIFAHFGRLDLGDVMFERRRYSSTRAYNQSKVATAMFTMELADRLDETGITVNCVSPGLVATHLMREHWYFGPSWLRALWTRWLLSPDEAAERIVRVATSAALSGVTGQCFATTLRPISLPRAARDEIARAGLWDLSARLTTPERPTVAGSR